MSFFEPDPENRTRFATTVCLGMFLVGALCMLVTLYPDLVR